jgi:hypothetical protein
MNPEWPTTLPQTPMMRGFGETPGDNVIRTSMDVGPPKLRRRSTAVPRNFTLVIRCTTAQIDILDDFFTGDCRDGSLPFDWKHPRTGGAATYVWGAPPKYAPVFGDFWEASMSLELQP